MGDFKVHHVRFFEYNPSPIHCLAYEKDLKKLAASRSDGTIEVWNLEENWLQEKILPPPEGQSVEALLWCKQRLFSAGLHGNIYEHDIGTGEIKNTASSNSGPIWCLAMNATGSQIVAGTENGCLVLFDVFEGGIEYHRILDKQEGRILSVAWYHEDDLIVTGGIDNIRIWSLKSGHAIQRLSLGRKDRNKETIVWTVAVTKDFTIVSGDSRGKTCFWNGKQGTLLKSFQSHRADVFTLCVHDNGTTVVSAGIDPTLVQFEFIPTNPNSEVRTWVRGLSRVPHTHDVRAVTTVENTVVSGGVDCRLVCTSLEGRSDFQSQKPIHIPGIPQAPVGYTAKTSNMVLFRHFDGLELWKLGSTLAKRATPGEFLKLDSNPVKLLELKSRDGEYITCAAVSHNGEWIAYADATRLRLFQVTIEENEEVGYPNVTMSRVRLLPPAVKTPHYMMFSPDGSTLYSATSSGDVQVIRLDPLHPELIHTLTPPHSDQCCSICAMTVSPSGRFLVTGDLSGSVHVYNLKKVKHVVTLPKYSHMPTALGFHPQRPLLAVAYSNQMVFEYDVTACEYTDWTRKHMHHFPTALENQPHKIRQVMYNPSNPEQILIRNVRNFFIIDKTEPFPDQSANIMRKRKGAVPHAFHSCDKFKFILHMDLFDSDYLMVVERTPVALLDCLPPTLKQKKFGT